MDKQTRTGFNLGLRVAATLLIDRAEELEAQAAQWRKPSVSFLADTAQKRRLEGEAVAADAKARLLREQAAVIRGTTPDQVHLHRN